MFSLMCRTSMTLPRIARGAQGGWHRNPGVSSSPALIEQVQFDTVYHEHFSYLSLYTVDRVFAAAGLRLTDVEELPTHGGQSAGLWLSC